MYMKLFKNTLLDKVSQFDDVGRSRLILVYQNQWLLFIDRSSTMSLPLPATLLNQPCCWYLNIFLINYIMRNI